MPRNSNKDGPLMKADQIMAMWRRLKKERIKQGRMVRKNNPCKEKKIQASFPTRIHVDLSHGPTPLLSQKLTVQCVCLDLVTQSIK